MPPLDLLITLICLGLCSGFLGGLLGIGGGVVIVPALVIIFDQTGLYEANVATVIAVATSLACIVFTALSAAYTQVRADKVRWDVFRRLILFFVVGSFCAGLFAPYLPGTLFRGLIGVFLLFVAAVMLTNWKPAKHRAFPGMVGGGAAGFVGGNLAGLAGIAGGNIIVPTLVFFNIPMHNATATSSAMGVPIALSGALSYAFANPQLAERVVGQGQLVGFVDITSFFAITLGAILTAPLGVKLAHRVPAATLKRAFGVLLLLVSARMLYSAHSLIGV